MAKAGQPPPFDRALSRYVDCDLFQDGRAFLLNGGQMGRQPEVLPGGASYAINTALFEVITVDTVGDGRYGLYAGDLREVAIPPTTGVVITLDGVPPDADEPDWVVGPPIPGHLSFQRPWLFLANGGQRGAQAETLPRGVGDQTARRGMGWDVDRRGRRRGARRQYRQLRDVGAPAG